MPVIAPSTPTIPPPSPRWQERKAGQRFARVHERLRRPNVARPWVRVGTPDALPHVRRRRDARDQRLFRRVFVLTSLVLAASLTVHVVSSHEIAPLDGHRGAYAAAADLVRNGEVVGDPSVWKADVAGAVGARGPQDHARRGIRRRAVPSGWRLRRGRPRARPRRGQRARPDDAGPAACVCRPGGPCRGVGTARGQLVPDPGAVVVLNRPPARRSARTGRPAPRTPTCS